MKPKVDIVQFLTNRSQHVVENQALPDVSKVNNLFLKDYIGIITVSQFVI